VVSTNREKTMNSFIHMSQFPDSVKREPMLVNPYTGETRDPRDVESDPFGILVIDPSKPLLAAK